MGGSKVSKQQPEVAPPHMAGVLLVSGYSSLNVALCLFVEGEAGKPIPYAFEAMGSGTACSGTFNMLGS